ncbi:unnamed protein product, partial [marine sediment metagenome]
IAMKFKTAVQSVLFSSCPYDPCIAAGNLEEPNNSDPSFHSMAIYIGGEDEDEVLTTGVSYDNWWAAGAYVDGVSTDNEWHFLVVTHDANGGDEEGAVTGLTTIYLDGVQGGEPGNFDPNLIDPNTHSIRIGTTRNRYYPIEEIEKVDMTGDIDDVRVYDRVLLHGEIVNLSGVPAGEWFYVPVDSYADLYEDEPAATSLESKRFVNFKDYTFLMQYWLTYQPFPPED